MDRSASAPRGPLRAARRLAAGLATAAVTLVVVLPPAPARACSCAEPDVADALRDPGQAVAVVRRLDGGRGGEGRFAVLHEVGERRLPPLVTAPVDDGGSCSIFLGRGGVGGAIVTRGRDGWTIGDCQQVGVGRVLAADAAAVPDPGAGPPVAVLVGEFGTDHVRSLDASGRLVAAGSVGGRPFQVVACGPDHVAVFVVGHDGAATSVALVDVATLALRWTAPAGRGTWVAAMACADADADPVVHAVARDMEGHGLVLHLAQGTATRRPVAGEPVGVLGDGTVVAVVNDFEGRRTRVTVDGPGSSSEHVVPLGYVDRVLPSPDGRLLALSGDGQVVLDRDSGTVRVVRHPQRDHEVTAQPLAWSGDSLVLGTGFEQRQDARLVAVAADDTMSDLGATPWQPAASSQAGATLLRAGSATTVLHDLATGDARSWGPLWTAAASSVVLLADVGLPARDAFAADVGAAVALAPTDDAAPTPSGASGVGEPGATAEAPGSRASAVVGWSVAAALVLGAGLLGRRRRRA